MSKQNVNIRTIFDRDTILHLRLPFSFFLLPVFCFGISQASSIHLVNTCIIFIAMHVFIYPGSNIYNSYMDKDTGSIGGLKNPPPVTLKLYYASIIFDITGLLLSAFAGWQNPLLIAGYVIFSKAYSWHGIRLKKYTLLSWLTVMILQGGYTFMLANMVTENHYSVDWFTFKNIECMMIASLIIGGSYPLTQIYQHKEDSLRGDYTLSYRLGIPGTFIFTLVFFSAGALVALHYFTTYYNINHFLVFTVCIIPVMIYFFYWFIKTLRNRGCADFTHTMLMNKISSICMIICFTTLIIINHFH